MENKRYLEIDGLEYDINVHRYYPTIDFLSNELATNVLTELDLSEDEFVGMIKRTGRQVYGYLLGDICWENNFYMKEYYITTTEECVELLREFYLSYFDACLQSSWDRVKLENPIDIENSKVIENFNEIIKEMKFDETTMGILRRNKHFYTNTRVDIEFNDLMKRNGY